MLAASGAPYPGTGGILTQRVPVRALQYQNLLDAVVFVVAEWRGRMKTVEAKRIYKDRASTAECVNAIARNRGLWQFLVRGLKKARAVVLWYALAHNMMRAVALGAC